MTTTLEDFVRRGMAAQAAVNDAIADTQPAAEVFRDELSTQAFNALLAGGGIYGPGAITLGTLRKTLPSRLLTLPRFWYGSLNEVIRALDSRGLSHKLGQPRPEGRRRKR